MKNTLLDINIFLDENKIQFITQTDTKEEDLSSVFNIKDFNINDSNELSLVTKAIKNELINQTSKLFGLTLEKTKYEDFLFDLLKNDTIKNKILDSLKELGLLKDIFKTKYYYEGDFSNIKNPTFFKRFLSKEDYSFSEFDEFDEFNEFINHLNGNYFNTLLFCELNNLKTVNNFISRDGGDDVIDSFMSELSESFEDCLIIRQGGDEFIILANDGEVNEIMRLLEDPHFLSTINNSLPLMQTQKGVNIFSTVSYGSAALQIPSRVFSNQSIIDFKKRFNISYCKAQHESFTKKTLIKKLYRHETFEDLNNRKEAKKLIEYQNHLQSKASRESLDGISNEERIKQLLESPRDLNITYRIGKDK